MALGRAEIVVRGNVPELGSVPISGDKRGKNGNGEVEGMAAVCSNPAPPICQADQIL